MILTRPLAACGRLIRLGVATSKGQGGVDETALRVGKGLNAMSKSPQCYASALGDCRGKRRTREHYFSKGILELLAPREIGGFHCLKPGQCQPSIASLTAKILCEKHHQELSSLDEVAAQVYRFFDEHVPAVVSGERRQLATVEVKGELLERWMLKTLVGLMASGNVLNEGARIRLRCRSSPKHATRLSTGLSPIVGSACRRTTWLFRR